MILSGCQFPSSGSIPIVITGETATLEWDPPMVRFPLPPMSIQAYRVYYSSHGSSLWTFLAEVPAAENPRLEIQYADFGDGSFDFAVSSVTFLGRESPLHASFDAAANPYGGWYLRWFRSN